MAPVPDTQEWSGTVPKIFNLRVKIEINDKKYIRSNDTSAKYMADQVALCHNKEPYEDKKRKVCTKEDKPKC